MAQTSGSPRRSDMSGVEGQPDSQGTWPGVPFLTRSRLAEWYWTSVQLDFPARARETRAVVFYLTGRVVMNSGRRKD
jgi:hypothetical protein